MIIVLTIHVRITPLVSATQTTSLVPVLQNIKVHCVKHIIFVMVKRAATTEIARMETKIILVIVIHNILVETVNKEISVIAILVPMESVQIQK